MRLTINRQSKVGGEISVYEGERDETVHSPVQMIQILFLIYDCEDDPWETIQFDQLAKNITEDEFNDLYNSGRRLFFLENEYIVLTVKFED